MIREAKDIKFWMYNENFPQDGKQIFINDEKRLKYLDKNLPIVFYIHGFTETAPGSSKSSATAVRDGEKFF